jgi:hypothetical protein
MFAAARSTGGVALPRRAGGRPLPPSRDLGNTWRVIFEDFASVRVTVIDCNTGMVSDGAGARLAFGAMALVNDTFLQLVKAETHRGLQGRAIVGFHTGGRCYGTRRNRRRAPMTRARTRGADGERRRGQSRPARLHRVRQRQGPRRHRELPQRGRGVQDGSQHRRNPVFTGVLANHRGLASAGWGSFRRYASVDSTPETRVR